MRMETISTRYYYCAHSFSSDNGSDFPWSRMLAPSEDDQPPFTFLSKPVTSPHPPSMPTMQARQVTYSAIPITTHDSPKVPPQFQVPTHASTPQSPNPKPPQHAYQRRYIEHQALRSSLGDSLGNVFKLLSRIAFLGLTASCSTDFSWKQARQVKSQASAQQQSCRRETPVLLTKASLPRSSRRAILTSPSITIMIHT